MRVCAIQTCRHCVLSRQLEVRGASMQHWRRFGRWGRSGALCSLPTENQMSLEWFVLHRVVKARGYTYCRLAPINRMAPSCGRVAPGVDPGPVVTPATVAPCYPVRPCGAQRTLALTESWPMLDATDIDSAPSSMPSD
ncbi:hypothetical protein ACJJTC_001251 [Scirpophaga incertulas]